MARRRFFGTLRWIQIAYCGNYYCDMCSSNSHSVDKTLRQTSDENFLLETSALISLSVLMALLSTLSCFYLSLRICKGVEFTVRRLKTFLNCFNIMYVYPCVQWVENCFKALLEIAQISPAKECGSVDEYKIELFKELKILLRLILNSLTFQIESAGFAISNSWDFNRNRGHLLRSCQLNILIEIGSNLIFHWICRRGHIASKSKMWNVQNLF